MLTVLMGYACVGTGRALALALVVAPVVAGVVGEVRVVGVGSDWIGRRWRGASHELSNTVAEEGSGNCEEREAAMNATHPLPTH